MTSSKLAVRAAWMAGIALVSAYAWVALRGPQGLPVLLEKHKEIRSLEEQNAALARENELRAERIKRLETSASEQEMEIRKQLKLLRPGDRKSVV